MPTSPASYDGTPLRLAKSCAHFSDGTRRRVHSPSWATSSSVTSVIVVRGSTKPSTPRRVRMKSSRCCWSSLSDPRTMEPVDPVPWPRRRNRSSKPMATSVLHQGSSLTRTRRLVRPRRTGGLDEGRQFEGVEADVPEGSDEGNQFDVVILGAGSGGYACALRAAQLGLSVALVEKDKVGGTCLHVGCIPTKALLHAAEVADAARESEKFGVQATLDGIDMAGVNSYKDGVVSRLYKGLTGLVKGRGITVIEGSGRLTGPRTVEVDGTSYVGKAVVLASGSYSRTLPGLEIDGTRVLTSEQALG